MRQIFTLRDKRSGLKQPPIEITNEQIGQELDMWFNNEACEALARETGFIRRSTSRLTGSAFFNLLTVEALDEPAISYEGLCDILEDRNSNAQITPQALCERMNSDGAVAFLEASLERSLRNDPSTDGEDRDGLARTLSAGAAPRQHPVTNT